MKVIQNPTQYFFEQSNNPSDQYLDKINVFIGKLINQKQCLLCKQDYNIKDRLPRILIHCGHTICTQCLSNFYRNRRVRCPLCLKLVKHLDSIERLPINHTIFTKMAEEINKKSRSHGGTDVIDPQQYLFTQFQQSAVQAQKIRQQQQNQYPQVDPDSGLEFCEFHNDRVKHFFCMKHKVTCCRVCSEMIHQKKDCIVVDLYEIEDVPAFLNEAYKLNQENNCQNQNIEFLPDDDNNFNDDDLEGEFAQDESLKSL
ncbi:unnamed protein product (macronuclear) [Paramecium tetraurelia]|uniref:RING-type domain-containing protein n=1 Tax=Paramecium tetraurelia TaxID=5888 RepID=A0DJL4_PARTE|nr:uncharacterized protein GSPATT00017575001 [Paramecium tetraurelia]CAK83231.1 unnamed protein product [Paramecium tetraurelia]|eukprot:XP_001450628.1 hypothetical protein (macronuclear) [Paramecium tetraurelia strain d4-2]